ncbi:MAG: cysteine hydrolase, partial [Burkholderiales bacterium PBB5]
MSGTALIVIDVHVALFDPVPRPHEADAVLTRIHHLARAARAAGVPVVWVQHESPHEGHPLAHGSPGWAVHPAAGPDAADVFIRKTTPDSFLRTGLAEWLATRGIGHLVVCGYASEYCVDTSTRRAAGLGLAVTLAADAHTTHDKPHASGALIRA